jgi:hypothetical protein
MASVFGRPGKAALACVLDALPSDATVRQADVRALLGAVLRERAMSAALVHPLDGCNASNLILNVISGLGGALTKGVLYH